jgi:hypothetical protein
MIACLETCRSSAIRAVHFGDQTPARLIGASRENLVGPCTALNGSLQPYYKAGPTPETETKQSRPSG